MELCNLILTIEKIDINFSQWLSSLINIETNENLISWAKEFILLNS